MNIMTDELTAQYQQTATEALIELHRSGTLTGPAYQAIEQELLRRGVSVSPRPTATATEDAPKGVGGWLMFFIFTYALSPFFAAGQYYIYQNELNNLTQQFPELETSLHIDTYLYICAFFLAAGSALTFYIVYELLWEMRGAVLLAKIGLLLFVANNILIAPTLKVAFFGYAYFGPAGFGEFMLVQCIISIPAVVWYIYFSISKRVKATYLSS